MNLPRFSPHRFLFTIALCLAASIAPAAEPGSLAVVIYNTQMSGSREVAEHYAKMRGTPAEQVLGFDLPTTETITRADFNEKLARPLLARLQALDLMAYDQLQASNGWPGKLDHARIRYAVVCYGVPLRILNDSSIVEPGADAQPPQVRLNGAALDAELTLLPSIGKVPLTGPLTNPFYGATNAATLGPGAGVLLVGRLDGPTAAVATQLVDKAMQAERDGLWGRAYFDLRGITNGPYLEGENWIHAASGIARHYGFDTVVDNNPGSFPADFPMSQIAIYAGWYASHATGPLAQAHVEFMPGAFAYHLFSYSASSLRDTNRTNEPWCEALLARGVTATMGCVDEPYLDGTPNVGGFLERWLSGFSFGEAALVCQKTLSWQTTVLGDPLYRPFGQSPKAQHESLLTRKSDLAAWSFVRIANVEKELGAPVQQCIDLLTKSDLLNHSAVLNEKLGDLYLETGNWAPARHAYERALKSKPTPLQRVRLEADLKSAKK